MSKIELCHPYAWEDPRYLFDSIWLGNKTTVCASEFVNQILFVYLFSFLVGLIAHSYTHLASSYVIALSAGTVYLIPTFMKLRAIEGFRSCDKDEKEGFTEKVKEFNNTGVPGTSFSDQTKVNKTNPFGNVLISEYPNAKTQVGPIYSHDSDGIVQNPKRPAAADITTRESKVALDEMFRIQWYSDPTDVFGKSQSQRMFVTQPVTTIPNDQGSYQDWLYKIPGKTCKEGGAANCYGGTEGAILPWLNM